MYKRQSDYSELKELVNFLIDEFRDKAVNISLPSLRIDAFALDVMSKVQDVKKSSLTFAPEAGSPVSYTHIFRKMPVSGGSRFMNWKNLLRLYGQGSLAMTQCLRLPGVTPDWPKRL